MKRWFLVSISVVVAALSLGISGLCSGIGYPTVQDAGFHHCALIYQRASRNVEELKPYVARYADGQPTSDWLFDSFLFLTQVTPSGKRTENEATNKADWLAILDQWFADGRDLGALDQAISETASALNVSGPPSSRQIMLCIPWLDPGVTDFGDVNGDGISESLATVAGRQAVLNWYVNEAHRRFAEHGYRNLSLWGFYWMREDIAYDSDNVRLAADIIHSAGNKLLWIPYFLARGWSTFRDCGIDVGIMQPNYAFTTWIDGGKTRRNRLATCAGLAQEYGLGVEIEVRGTVFSGVERQLLLQYLCDGAAGRYGYQDAPTAYYLGLDAVGDLYRSSDPDDRQVYDALCDYVVGQPVPDPDRKLNWTWQGGGSGQPVIAQALLSQACHVACIDAYLDEDPGSCWKGKVSVEVQKPGSSRFVPCAWAMRSCRDGLAGRLQVITVPVVSEVTGLRVTFIPEPGSPALSIVDVVPDEFGPKCVTHLGINCKYTTNPPRSAALYGDNGRMLVDGVISMQAAYDTNVGWSNCPGGVCTIFDLGRLTPVSSIEMYTRGGGDSAINWPLNPVAILSQNAPVYGITGFGSCPSSISFIPGSSPVIDRTRSATDMDGRVIFTPSAPFSARYVDVFSECQGWLFCSEIRIMSNGQNVAPLARYISRPLPPSVGVEAYPDNGAKLTDGIVATDFQPSLLTGWLDDGVRTFVVDLGALRRIRKVTAMSLGGGGYGIHGPALVDVAISNDRVRWTSLGRVRNQETFENGTCVLLPYTVNPGVLRQCRYVRVLVRRSQGWAMLSEIAVQ